MFDGRDGGTVSESEWIPSWGTDGTFIQEHKLSSGCQQNEFQFTLNMYCIHHTATAAKHIGGQSAQRLHLMLMFSLLGTQRPSQS